MKETEAMRAVRLPELINLDKLFADSEPSGARIINNDTMVSSSLSKEFTDDICSSIDGELGYVPTCKCGHIKGKGREGQLCTICNTKCSSQFVNELEHILWIGISQQLPPVIHPIWYRVLATLTKTANVKSIIDFILNPDIDERKLPKEFRSLITGRGFQWFYENADKVLWGLVEIYSMKNKSSSKRATAEVMKNFISLYRDCLFTRKLPILHNSLHTVATGGHNLNYVDGPAFKIIDVVNSLSALTFRKHSTIASQQAIEASLYESYIKCIEYYHSLIYTKVGMKSGLLRKQCCGSRLHFTLRSVITAHDVVLPFDEISLPWGIMVEVSKLVIINFLTHRYGCKYTVAEALAKHRHALTTYDPEVDRCMMDFIREKPGHRWPILIGRNPTIQLGSILLLYVSDYKRDPEDQSIALNATVITKMNADFDGDELYGVCIFENELAKAMSAVHPSQLTLSLQHPGISPDIGLLKQNCVCLEQYLEEDNDSDYYEDIC